MANNRASAFVAIALGLTAVAAGGQAQQTQPPRQEPQSQQPQRSEGTQHQQAPLQRSSIQSTVEVISITTCVSRNFIPQEERGGFEITFESLQGASDLHEMWFDRHENSLPVIRDFALDVETEILPGSNNPEQYGRRAIIPRMEAYVDAKELFQEQGLEPNLEFAWADFPHSIFSFDGKISWNFESANLENVEFDTDGPVFADFKGANLEGAEFRSTTIDAFFEDANLVNANFGCSEFLNDASFDRANLTGANFREVQFSFASFVGANLNGVDFTDAKFTDEVIYEPASETMPDLGGIASAGPLEFLTYENDRTALVELRDAFREAGYKQQADTLTYAIRRTARADLADEGLTSLIDSWFQLVFFELPVAYGKEKARPLLVMLGGIFLFAFPYYLALTRFGSDGIWRKWHPERVRQDLGQEKPERLRLSGFQAAYTAIYFSMLSAFHIGWRDLNVGSWLSRLQTREFTYSASGWVRSLSGFQSLLSVYLLALWALSYFGQPFD